MKNHQTVESREPGVKVTSEARAVCSCHPSLVTRHACRAEAERRRAFTLIELLTVIAIIAILAAILLPTLASVKIEAQKKQARLQISGLVTAIQEYDSAYNQMPIPDAAEKAVSTNCYAFGGTFKEPNGTTWPDGSVGANYFLSNSDVIAILMDLTVFPGTATPTVNANHQKDPKKTLFLNAKMVGYTNYPGVGPDLVYRDPWKNPYVITMDANEDNQCTDPFYALRKVSQLKDTSGFNGLVNPIDANGNGNNFQYHGNVMVWSAGPDGKIDPAIPANQGVNADNILSWQ